MERHWPDCNWCQGGQAHLSTGGNRTGSEDAPNNATMPKPAEDGGDVEYGDGEGDAQDSESDTVDGKSHEDGENGLVGQLLDLPLPIAIPFTHKRMINRRARSFAPAHGKGDTVARSSQGPIDSQPLETLLHLPTGIPNVASSSTTTEDVFSATETGVENARKTSTKWKGKNTHKAVPTKPKGSSTKCTPSPTKSLAPTWTTCKYVTRDGKLNPDVHQLHGVEAIADASQSIIFNAIASVLTSTASYAQSAAQAIDVFFFFDMHTGMHPRVLFGQVIRGPQKQVGQYRGVSTSAHSMVKVANAVLIIKAAHMSAWNANLNSKMQSWTMQYIQWLQTSTIGKKAISAPNNHGTFVANQLAAMNILAGDEAAAASALRSYFQGQYLDQIAASGEQPFEAVRTRPFHYRCFNLEAMIVNAKLGDQLGLNFWTVKSKYGATIKDALDYVMRKGPGKEDVTDIFPHIAAVYGDPGGRYMAYLKQMDSHFMTAPYYYYDQPAALTQAHKASKEVVNSPMGEFIPQHGNLQDVDRYSKDNLDELPREEPNVPWECPAAFTTKLKVQLDDGIFVTCAELKPFYGYVKDAEKQP